MLRVATGLTHRNRSNWRLPTREKAGVHSDGRCTGVSVVLAKLGCDVVVVGGMHGMEYQLGIMRVS